MIENAADSIVRMCKDSECWRFDCNYRNLVSCSCILNSLINFKRSRLRFWVKCNRCNLSYTVARLLVMRNPRRMCLEKGWVIAIPRFAGFQVLLLFLLFPTFSYFFMLRILKNIFTDRTVSELNKIQCFLDYPNLDHRNLDYNIWNGNLRLSETETENIYRPKLA